MSTATDIIADARNYAAETYDNADDLISSAQNKISASWAISPDYDYTTQSYDLTIDIEEPEDFRGVYFPPINNTLSPIYTDITIPNLPENIEAIGDFDKSDLYNGAPPIFDVGDFGKDAPIVNAIVLPDTPEYIEIPYPELRETITPEFNGVAIPEFNAELLANIPDNPDDIVKAYKDTYDEVLPEMKAFIDEGANSYLSKYAPEYENNRFRLITRINKTYDEGTGLAESVEQGIYDRGRARAESEVIRLQNQVLEQADKLGMFVPPGAISSAMNDIQKVAAMANAQYSAETTIEKAKLELNHLQFVMQLSDGIRNTALQMSLQYVNTLVQINGQALEHGKNVANIMTDLYNLEVKRFEVALQYLSIQSQVYETQFKAALADLEVFKVEAEVAKLNNDLNKSDVDLFVARVGAQETRIKIYVAEIDGISTGVSAEATAVSAFGEEVRAYKALIDAKSSEFNAYTSAINGNKVKSDIYSSEVNAYKTRVDAQTSQTGNEIAINEAVNSHNTNLTNQYKAELSAYTTEIDAESTKFKSEAQAYTSNLEGYKSSLAAKQIKLQSDAELAKLDLNAVNSYYNTTSQFRINNARVKNDGFKNIADVAMHGAGVYTDIAGAALQSQNTMVEVVES